MFSYPVFNGTWFWRPLSPSMDCAHFVEIWNSERRSIAACGLSREAFAFARGWKAAWSIFVGNFRIVFLPGIRCYVVLMPARRFRDDKNRFSQQRRRRATRWIRALLVRAAVSPRANRSPSSFLILVFSCLEVRFDIIFLPGESQVQ